MQVGDNSFLDRARIDLTQDSPPAARPGIGQYLARRVAVGEDRQLLLRHARHLLDGHPLEPAIPRHDERPAAAMAGTKHQFAWDRPETRRHNMSAVQVGVKAPREARRKPTQRCARLDPCVGDQAPPAAPPDATHVRPRSARAPRSGKRPSAAIGFGRSRGAVATVDMLKSPSPCRRPPASRR